MVREDLNLEELEWSDSKEFKVDEDALVRSMVETLQAGKINKFDIDKTKVIPTEEVLQAELMDDGEDTEVEELLNVVDTQRRNTGVMFTDLLEDGPEMVESFEETRSIPVAAVSMDMDDTQDIMLTEDEMEELGDLNYHDDDVVSVKKTAGVPKKHPGQARSQSNRRNMSERAAVSTGDGRNIRVQRKKKNAFERFLLNLSWVDAVIAITGVLVAAVLIFVLVFWNSNNNKVNDLGEFTAVGMQLSDLDTIGQNGINRIVSTSGSSVMGEASVPATNGGEEKKIMVSVSFTSLERDLKIKFTDKATDKLLEGVAFELEVITPSNETLTWVDEDKDGMIYQEGLAPGAYMIIIKSVGEFAFPSDATKVMVKDTISYQVINVLDEIKTEDEINVAVEDTQDKGNIDSETLLADTIKWVPSDKKVSSGADGYAAIDKATITDPATLTTAALGGFWKVNTVSLKVGESADVSINGFTEDTSKYDYSYSWSSGNTGVATVSGSGQSATITGVGVGEGVSIVCDITITPKDTTTGAQPGTDQKVFTAVVTAAETSEPASSETPSEKPSETPSEKPSETPSEKPSETPSEKPSETPSEKPSENPSEKPPVTAYVTGIMLDQTTLEIKMGATATLKATVAGDAGVDKTVEWTSDDTKIVTVDKKTGVITPVAVGTATITATTVGRNANGGVMFAECKVTVKPSGTLTLTVNPTSADVLVGETYKIEPVVANFASDKTVTFSVDKEEIATVDKDGVVTGVAKGTAVVTITTNEKGTDGKAISIEVTITVKANPKKDTTTLLKDSNGNQVYIKAADGSYVQAKWADYYTATAFYIQSDPTYTYYGWQTLNGKTYFFDENGKKVTGEQVISGVKYNFASDGSLSMNGGVLGIDVSKWNGTIDWNAVKSSGISFVIIRCGYRGSATGVLVQDPKFESYISGATRAGLKVGLYFFSQAINEKEAVEEASMAIALAQDYKITYPIFIDTEWTSGGRANNLSKETRTAICKAFCETIKSAGYTPGIYACKTWYQDSLNVSVLNGYKIWLAQYASQPTYNARYDMWQYTDQGKVNGISTNVDLNISYLGY